MKTASKEESEWIFRNAHDLSVAILKWFENKPRLRENTMTITGYAIEMILGLPVAYSGKEYDESSEEFRRFLEQAHKDIKAAAAKAS